MLLITVSLFLLAQTQKSTGSTDLCIAGCWMLSWDGSVDRGRGSWGTAEHERMGSQCFCGVSILGGWGHCSVELSVTGSTCQPSALRGASQDRARFLREGTAG